MPPIVQLALISQGDTSFSVYSRGNQCTAIAVTFCSYLFVQNGTLPQTVECLTNIVRIGDHVYTVSRHAREEQARQQGHAFRHIYLSVDEIPTIQHPDLCPSVIKVISGLEDITGAWVKEQRIGWEVLSPHQSAEQILQHNQQRHVHFIAAEILEVMQNGEVTPYCVFTYNGYTYALCWTGTVFAVFNSHSCNEHGLPSPNGRAAMLTTASVEEAARCIIQTLLPYPVQQDLTCQWAFINFERLEQATSVEQHNAVVPDTTTDVDPPSPLSCDNSSHKQYTYLFCCVLYCAWRYQSQGKVIGDKSGTLQQIISSCTSLHAAQRNDHSAEDLFNTLPTIICDNNLIKRGLKLIHLSDSPIVAAVNINNSNQAKSGMRKLLQQVQHIPHFALLNYSGYWVGIARRTRDYTVYAPPIQQGSSHGELFTGNQKNTITALINTLMPVSGDGDVTLWLMTFEADSAIVDEPDCRDARRQRDAQAHRDARMIPEVRAEEQQRNTQAHRDARMNPEFRAEEQQRNTQAHRDARAARPRSQRATDDVYYEAELAGLSARREEQRPPNYSRYYRVAILRCHESEKHFMPLSQPCRHCQANRFSGEKVKCCKQGLIKIPEAQIPDELRALFSCDERTERNSFVDIFRQYARVTNEEYSLLAPNCQAAEVGTTGPVTGVRFSRQPATVMLNQRMHYHININASNTQLFPLHSANTAEHHFRKILERLRQPNSCVPERIAEYTNKLRQFVYVIDNILRQRNYYVQAYKTSGELQAQLEAANQFQAEVVAPENFNVDPRTFNAPTEPNELAIAVYVPDTQRSNRDVVHWFATARNSNEPMYVNSVSEHRIPMTFPILFLLAEPGWSPTRFPYVQPQATVDIHPEQQTAADDEPDSSDTASTTSTCSSTAAVSARRNQLRGRGRQGHCTLYEYAQYLLTRRDAFSLLQNSGKLYQEFALDLFMAAEGAKLRYHQSHQEQYRPESFINLQEFLDRVAAERQITRGSVSILPPSFTGSHRWYVQQYRNAMVVVREHGQPNLFVTFTCNPQWPEIRDFVKNRQGKVQDFPDISCRVFALKLKSLLDDIEKKHIFGRVQAVIYSVEFQKRGLPHAHMLIFLSDEDQITTVDDIDRVISAEIPDPQEDKTLHDMVISHMIHTCSEERCGRRGTRGLCKRKFPKAFSEHTILNNTTYPVYRRRDNIAASASYKRRKTHAGVDVPPNNQDVVPYSPYLLRRYNAHINVEISISVEAIKYIFKYIFKGADQAVLCVRRCTNEDGTVSDIMDYNEARHFIKTRFCGSAEAMWRFYEFGLHYSSYAIIDLPVPKENDSRTSAEKFTAWLSLNQRDDFARTLLYIDVPKYYRWNKPLKSWTRYERQVKRTLGSLDVVFPSDRDRYYLRLILLHIRGPRCTDDLLTVNGQRRTSYAEAAIVLGLVENSIHFIRAMEQAVIVEMPCELRKLFVLMILNSDDPELPMRLWTTFDRSLYLDFLRLPRRRCTIQEAELLALNHIRHLLGAAGRQYNDFRLPPIDYVPQVNNVDDYNDGGSGEAQTVLPAMVNLEERLQTLNSEQRAIFETIMTSIQLHEGRLFYINGAGGTGKTYLYVTLCAQLRHVRYSFVAAAYTGLAALLLPAGQTIHKAFNIPVPCDDGHEIHYDTTTFNGRRLFEASVLLIDEISMVPKHIVHIIDRGLRLLMGVDRPFGGKTVIFGGDFRQLLPVNTELGVPGSAADCFTESYLWNTVETHELHTNMRIQSADMAGFRDWLLRIGNGVNINGYACNTVSLPRQNVLRAQCTPEEEELFGPQNGAPASRLLARAIFGETLSYDEALQCADRVILTSEHNTILQINDDIITHILQGESQTYLSEDTNLEASGSGSETRPIADVEVLNAANPHGIPPHQLRLKCGTICYICKNLSVRDGLANGTRCIVERLLDFAVYVHILTGPRQGTKIVLPRVKFIVNGARDAFHFSRIQLPIIPAFAMTIHKSQGQSFNRVGVFLEKPVFAHGQLYVAFSRVTSATGLFVDAVNANTFTQNFYRHPVSGELRLRVHNFVLHDILTAARLHR